jgi:hypothetical protein
VYASLDGIISLDLRDLAINMSITSSNSAQRRFYFSVNFSCDSSVILREPLFVLVSGLLGYAMGFALKKILKWMLTIVGFIAWMFVVVPTVAKVWVCSKEHCINI